MARFATALGGGNGLPASGSAGNDDWSAQKGEAPSREWISVDAEADCSAEATMR